MKLAQSLTFVPAVGVIAAGNRIIIKQYQKPLLKLKAKYLNQIFYQIYLRGVERQNY